MPGFHHIELWIAEHPDDVDRALLPWRWLLLRVGFERAQAWPGGESWAAGGAYLTLTASPRLSSPLHDRRRAGLNHVAFHGGDRAAVDAIVEEAPANGWTPLYADRYPHAGGPQHYAAWFENDAGFKVEVVAG